MRYKRLGCSGLFVSELCLGTMTFGGQGFWKSIGALDLGDVERLVGRALDQGINFIDTANVYSGGMAEELTGRALQALGAARDQVVIATKVHGEMGPGPNQRGASRGHIMDSVKASLKRLQLDHIDLYQLHGFDPATPMEETIGALDSLVEQGLVRYVGVSNWAAWQIARALGLAERLNRAKFVSTQSYYTLAGRDIEREIVPLIASEGLGLLVWSPLAGGLLSGKYGRNKQGEEGSRRLSFDFPPVAMERAYAVIDALEVVAAARGTSVARVALAWLLHQPAVSSVIIGAKTMAQLDDNIAATTLALNPSELAALDQVSRLPPEYPGWMSERMAAARLKQMTDAAAPREAAAQP